MKKLGIELLFKPLCFKNAKTFNTKSYFFSSMKKVKDTKQTQLKKDEINDTKIIKTSNNLKNVQKTDLKN